MAARRVPIVATTRRAADGRRSGGCVAKGQSAGAESQPNTKFANASTRIRDTVAPGPADLAPRQRPPADPSGGSGAAPGVTLTTRELAATGRIASGPAVGAPQSDPVGFKIDDIRCNVGGPSDRVRHSTRSRS